MQPAAITEQISARTTSLKNGGRGELFALLGGPLGGLADRLADGPTDGRFAWLADSFMGRSPGM